jgi:hypothetical protein
MMEKEDPPSIPYLTTTLLAPQAELDLSNSTPSRLTVTATLHAPTPIFCYIADTFLHPQNALRVSGIEFTKLGDHPQPIQRSSVYINTGNSTIRLWISDHFTLFQPLEPVSIEVPFGSLKRGIGVFDHRFSITTSGFEIGCEYKATLPTGCMISWWRWASPDEGQSGDTMAIPLSSIARNDLDDEGVPLLPEEQQLHIHTCREKVTFTCIGQPVGPSQQI